jgi:hypothetical protein
MAGTRHDRGELVRHMLAGRYAKRSIVQTEFALLATAIVFLTSRIALTDDSRLGPAHGDG